MMHPWRGRNAAQILQKTSCGARRLKTIRQPLSGEVIGKSVPFLKDDIVANLSGTASGGSKPTPDKDESAAPLRRGGKSVPFLKDDIVANLPRTASGGSKPTPDKDESAAPLKKGGKTVIPAEQDAFLMEADFPRDLRRTTIRRRSNAWTHSHSQRLASLKASARAPIPPLLLNLPVFERYNRATLLRMRCLGSPTGN